MTKVKKTTNSKAAKAAPAKAAPAKAAPAKADKPKPVSKTKLIVEYLTPYIKQSKFTQPELLDKVLTKYPDIKKSTAQTILVDSKNTKYNRFAQLVKKTDKGVLTFVKTT